MQECELIQSAMWKNLCFFQRYPELELTTILRGCLEGKPTVTLQMVPGRFLTGDKASYCAKAMTTLNRLSRRQPVPIRPFHFPSLSSCRPRVGSRKGDKMYAFCAPITQTGCGTFLPTGISALYLPAKRLKGSQLCPSVALCPTPRVADFF